MNGKYNATKVLIQPPLVVCHRVLNSKVIPLWNKNREFFERIPFKVTYNVSDLLQCLALSNRCHRACAFSSYLKPEARQNLPVKCHVSF
jgi:hypothetical protein